VFGYNIQDAFENGEKWIDNTRNETATVPKLTILECVLYTILVTEGNTLFSRAWEGQQRWILNRNEYISWSLK